MPLTKKRCHVYHVTKDTHPNVTSFQQDNARPHTACLSMDSLHPDNVEVIPWPAFSPDLSPI